MHYIANNRTFWKDIVAHADTVALKELALAAIRTIIMVTTARWSSDDSIPVPSSSIATPEHAYVAIISPPALEYVLPYLMKPAQSFSNLVGGRGDTESAAYKIATAKYDALRALHDRLAEHVKTHSDSGFEDVVTTLAKRVAAGAMSSDADVGGRVATLEL